MKVPVRVSVTALLTVCMSFSADQQTPLNRNDSGEEKSDYANYRSTRISKRSTEMRVSLPRDLIFYLVTLFQVPHYDQLQVLICNDNNLTTLAGVEHIKHLWKLDVSNNQV